jgi:hypothetical protein
LRKRFFVLIALTSCHGACGSKSNSANDDGSAGDSATAVVDAATFAAARCNAVTHRASLGSPLDIGDAVTTNDGFAIGLVREKNVFSVALVSSDLAKVTFVDIGPSRAEAGPPQPFLWQKSVYVAWIDSGDLRLGRIDDGKVAMIGEEVIDLLTYGAKDPVISDIPSLDVAVSGDHGAVTWDFADASRGHVRFVTFTKNGFDKGDGGLDDLREDVPRGSRGLPWVDISPVSSDADSPRLAPRAGGGYWGIWVARKAEPVLDASTIEGPGETPTLRWLEAAPLDDHGTRVGAVVKLTPDTGRVGGYDVLTNADGTDVIVRDATEALDEGTSLFRAHLATSAAPAEIIASEIGRAEPDVVSTQSSGGLGAPGVSWIVTPDMNDVTRVVPLLKGGALPQLPSLEPTLKSARALALRSANSGVDLLAMHALSVGGSPDQAEILLVSCTSP